MTPFFAAIIATGVAALATLLGGFFSHRFAHYLANHTGPVVVFSAGLLLALTFTDLLPESYALSGASTFPVILVGIVLFYILESFLHIHACPDHLSHDECHTHVLGPLTIAGFALHSFFDGLILVITFLDSATLGVLIASGLLIHRLADGAVLHTILCTTKSGKSLIPVAVVACMAPLAALAATPVLLGMYKIPEQYLGMGLALAAGTLLYLTLADMLPRTHEDNRYKNLAWLVIGIATFLLIAKVLPEA